MIEKIRESIKDIEFYNSINDLFINNSLNKLVIIDKSMIMKSFPNKWMSNKIKEAFMCENYESTYTSGSTSERMQIVRPKDVSIRPRACFFPLFSFLPLWLHYNLNPLCVQY